MPEKFPKSFLWGASTASHQVEGGTKNQWSEWELSMADTLASTAKERLDYLSRYGHKVDWPAIAEQAARRDNYISGAGVEHFDRYEADFELLKKLNLNAYRFSVEWSRIEPEPGQWDQAALDHYHAYIAKLKELKIEPILTIWHWTMPTWFTDRGGFSKRRNLKYFYAFVAKIAEEYGSELNYVLTLNEPNVYILASYIMGLWPPQKKQPLTAIRINLNLVKAHRQAYRLLKGQNPKLKVSLAMNLAQAYAISPKNPINVALVRLKSYIANWWFLNRVRHNLDFIGINFYSTEYWKWNFKLTNPDGPYSDVGWYMEPKAIYDLLIETNQRYHLPLIITENGVADADDSRRQWWIEQTIQAMAKALAAKVPLRGYLHWSLMDNFEWSHGWWPKFGLVEVDRANMKRTIRPSAKWFASEVKKLS